MRERQRIDDTLSKLLDNLVQSSYILKGHRYLARTHDLHRDRLLIGSEHQLLLPPVIVLWWRIVILKILVAVSFSIMVAEYALQPIRRREGLLLCFLLGTNIRVESGEYFARGKIGEDGLSIVSRMFAEIAPRGMQGARASCYTSAYALQGLTTTAHMAPSASRSIHLRSLMAILLVTGSESSS